MASLPISELEVTHPDYNPVVSAGTDKAPALRALETYSDFYSGGRKFTARKEKYLRTRPIDAISPVNRQARLSCSYYTPHSGGIGDNLCGTALQYPPTIEVRPITADKEIDPEDDAVKYWLDLNQNIDGKGSNTRSMAWKLLNSLIVNRRAYIAVDFRNIEKKNDASFTALCAAEVDDWQTDENGKYEWVRTHCVDLIRSKGQFSPQDTERHTWTFYTDIQIEEYTADRPIGATAWPSINGQAPMAVAKAPQAHGLGEVPIYPIEVEENFWVMDRLFSTAHAYFNREASRSFAIDTGALTLPVVKTDKDISGMVTSNGMAIKLAANTAEDFFWRSPDAGIYTALQNDCDYLLGNLYGALNQMALTAAAQSGNPRQSGVAKTADAAAIKAFLSLLCSPIMAGFRKAFTAVQKYRDEETDFIIGLHGMDKFDVQSIELEINRCASYVAIPGVPPLWKEESIIQATRSYMPDMDQEKWDEGKKQIQDAIEKLETPEPTIAPNMDENGKPQLKNDTTGRPNGFSPEQVSQQYQKPKVEQKKQVA